MGCATDVVKYVVFFFNLVFALAGLALLTVGVLFKLNVDEATSAIEKHTLNFSLAPTLMIIFGVVVFVIAFFGCCGAIRESSCMLTTYAIILLTIFILQVALGVFAFLQMKNDPNDNPVKEEIRTEIQRLMDNYNNDFKARESLDSIQYLVKCCGVASREDWVLKWHNGTAPSSCCDDKPQYCPLTSAYRDGCADKLWDFIHKTINIIGYVALGIALTELIGAIFALCLASSIRNYHRRGHYA